MVLILGAGFSGLWAAVLLKRRGVDVTVIEARNRIGGRVYTKTADNLTYEMGGEWIGSKDTLLLEACAAYGLELVDHALKTQYLYKGTFYPLGKLRIDESWLPHVQQLVNRFESLSEEEVRYLQRVNWHEFLTQDKVPSRDLDLLELVRSTDFGEDMRFIPAYDVLYDYMVGGDGPTACAKSIKSGNVAFARKCVEEIGEANLHLNEEIVAVIQSAGKVEAVSKSGKRYFGNALVAAVPASAVRSIAWAPALPEDQAEAYAEIEYSRILKTAAHFRERFWPDETFELVTDLLPQQIYHATPGQLEHNGVLISYAVGDRAQILSHMSPEEKGEEMRKPLQATTAAEVPMPDSIDSYYWGDDPYTHGAYPRFSGDQHTRLQPLFRAAHGGIFFAGEHTAKRYGFMEGAIEAGERAANEVVQRLRTS